MRETTQRLTLALIAWALCTPGGVLAGAPSATEGPAVEEQVVERFALFAQAGGDAEGAREVLGLVEWRRQPVAHGLQLQRDVHFVEHGRKAGRVVHIERLTDRNARLVWREIASASGRSLLVEWARDERGLRAFEWGRDGARRVTLEAWNGVVLPLYLIELARTGATTQGKYVTFDPLGRRLETVSLRTSYSIAGEAAPQAAAGQPFDAIPSDLPWNEEELALGTEAGAPLERTAPGASRTVEFVRRDGTLVGRYSFRGAELVEFQLQAGGPVARRVSRQTYARLLKGLEEAEGSDP
jgi:hypothetical protein